MAGFSWLSTTETWVSSRICKRKRHGTAAIFARSTIYSKFENIEELKKISSLFSKKNRSIEEGNEKSPTSDEGNTAEKSWNRREQWKSTWNEPWRLAENNRKIAGKARSGGETIRMNQETISSGFFKMRCVINKIVGISFSNGEKKRAENKTSLQHFDEYK